MAKLDMSWTAPVEAEHPHEYWRLYENGIKIVDNIGEPKFSLLMDDHKHQKFTYTVTTVDADTKLESLPSNSVDVNFFPPAAPTGLKILLVA